MEKKILFMLFIAFGMLFTMGCVGSNNPVKTQEDVTDTVEDITVDVSDLQDTLDDIDSSFG